MLAGVADLGFGVVLRGTDSPEAFRELVTRAEGVGVT